MTSLSRTPLHQLHVDLGAKLVDFAGWELPIQYPAGVMAEHLHTRADASLFDVSHMGQVLLIPTSGDVTDAAAALETITPASIVGLATGRQRYALLTTAEGGIGDDVMVAHQGDRLLVVVNAARREHDLPLLEALDGVEASLVTDRALLAIQGPAAATALARLVPEVADMVFMDAHRIPWRDVELWVSRSGYTGEDGFEVSVPAGLADGFARELLAMDEVAPAGLGARDSLRLEAGLPLYGHDLSTETSPAVAGLGWSVPKVRRHGGSREGGFPGAEIILPELADGVAVARRGLLGVGRAPVREGTVLYASEDATEPLGTVTSGGFGPSVGGPIAMAPLPVDLSDGETVYADVRGRRHPMTVAPLPFVKPTYQR